MTSASTVQKYGTSSAPVARQAVIPWWTWAIPASPWPCMASAHPRMIVPWANPLWKALLGREYDGGLCLFVHGRHVPAKLKDDGCPTWAPRQTIGMRQLVCQRHGLVEAGQGLAGYPSNQRVIAA